MNQYQQYVTHNSLYWKFLLLEVKKSFYICWSYMNNIAFVDGQNLHLWTHASWWQIDFVKFRRYLKDKFHIQEAYYYLWFVDDEQQDLYNQLQKAWFIVTFREHSATLKGKKKWNVDSDMIFDVMKRIHSKKDFDKIVLVSGDGDYIKLIKYLIGKSLLTKILFPNNHYSSLYKAIKHQYGMILSMPEIQHKIAYHKHHNSTQRDTVHTDTALKKKLSKSKSKQKKPS